MTIIPPVFIHPSAKVEGSSIGPHVSISAECEVIGCVIRNSILDDGAAVTDSVLDGSFIGRYARVENKVGFGRRFAVFSSASLCWTVVLAASRV